MNNELRIRDREGNLLVESIVAISVIMIGFLGVLGLLSRSLGINKDVGNKFIATYLAAEGIEVVKSLIDDDFASGNPFNTTVSGGSHEVSYDSAALTTLSSDPAVRSSDPLLFDSSDGSYNYATGDATIFRRTVVIEEIERNSPPDGVDEIKVNSIVEWSVRGVPQEINLEDHFFDWR